MNILHLFFSGLIKEEFAGFIEAVDVTGQGLADLVIRELNNLGLDFANCRAQCYDGAASMRGSMNGCQAILRRLQPKALYVHCFNHRLNLVLSAAAQQRDIRNTLGIIQKTCTFIRSSAKRIALLEDSVASNVEIETRRKRLKQLCPTRWVERHDAVLVFKELLPCILPCLRQISTAAHREAAVEADGLSKSMQTPSFAVALEIVCWTFSTTVSLSEALQSSSIHLAAAYERIGQVLNHFKNSRENDDVVFADIWLKVQSLAEVLDIEITMPRLTARQTNRSNIVVADPSDYYRISIFLPWLDDFIGQMTERFPPDDDKSHLSYLQVIVSIA